VTDSFPHDAGVLLERVRLVAVPSGRRWLDRIVDFFSLERKRYDRGEENEKLAKVLMKKSPRGSCSSNDEGTPLQLNKEKVAASATKGQTNGV